MKTYNEEVFDMISSRIYVKEIDDEFYYVATPTFDENNYIEVSKITSIDLTVDFDYFQYISGITVIFIILILLIPSTMSENLHNKIRERKKSTYVSSYNTPIEEKQIIEEDQTEI